MALVYAPVLLFVSSTGSDLWTFTYSAISCIAGVVALSAAVVGYWLMPMNVVFRILMAKAGLVAIAPSLTADLVALIIAAPAIIQQLVARKIKAKTSDDRVAA